MKGKEHIIIIKSELPTLNEYTNENRTHPKKGNKMKKTATSLVAWFANGSKVAPIKGIVDIKFIWTPKGRHDHDNIAFAKKFVLDGLVWSGILVNDSPKFVGNFIDEFKAIDEKHPQVEVILTERE